MTKEQLMALGLTAEQADAVLAAHKTAIDGNFVPKATFEAERDKVKTLTTQVGERDTQISELGKFKGTAEQLQTKVTELETKNKQDKEKFDAEITKIAQNALVSAELQGKVVDIDDVLPKLDFSKIVFKEGKIESGFTDQLDALKKTKPHYFKEDKPADDVSGLFPKGFVVAGKTPAEGTKGQEAEKGSEAAEFGKNLALYKTQGNAQATKAEDHYFK